MQLFIALLIVAAAAAYWIYTVVKNPGAGCSCDCSGCSKRGHEDSAADGCSISRGK